MKLSIISIIFFLIFFVFSSSQNLYQVTLDKLYNTKVEFNQLYYRLIECNIRVLNLKADYNSYTVEYNIINYNNNSKQFSTIIGVQSKFNGVAPSYSDILDRCENVKGIIWSTFIDAFSPANDGYKKLDKHISITVGVLYYDSYGEKKVMQYSYANGVLSNL